MNKKILASICAPLCAICLGMAPTASAQTLYCAGDSTLDEHDGVTDSHASWGYLLRPVLREGCSIVNYAKGGRSTTSFIREGWWGAITNSLVAGDFVVIQFGHNDQRLNDASVATPIPQYKENLRRMAAEVRAKGATPVFATPIVRLTYGSDGKLVDNEDLDAWAEAMRETATELGADLVDMRVMTREAANEAGESEALTWYAPGDRTHPAVKGARIYAGLFLGNVRQRALPIAALFDSTATLEDDLSIPFGTSMTITDVASFGTLVVNGDLVLAEGSLVAATKFFVSQGNSGRRATVTLGSNAKISIPSWTESDGDVRCVIGDGSPATLTMNSGSKVELADASDMRLARDISSTTLDGQTPVQVLLNDATLDVGGLSGRNTWRDGESWVVSLNGKNALLRPKYIDLYGNYQSGRIRFNGGLVKFEKWYSYGNRGSMRTAGWMQNLVLESVDGNPIRFSCYGGSSAASLFQIDHNNTIETSGRGTFQMERLMPTAKPLAILKESGSRLAFGHTGGFRVLAGANMTLDQYSSAAILATAGGNDLAVEVGGIVDLNGADVTFDGVVSAGMITNTTATAATLTVGVNGGDANFGIAPKVPVVKTGAGALRIPEGDLASVSVQEGMLDLCDRAAVGYPYYRFWMRAKKSDVNYTGISEFALYNGASEVTSLRTAASQVLNGGYISGNAGHVFDRDFTTAWRDGGLGYTSEGDWRHGNRQDFVIHYGNAPSFEFENGSSYSSDHVPDMFANPSPPASPSPLQSVTSYTFAYDGGSLDSTPTEWYFQGAMKGNEWRNLDHVTSYDADGGTAGAWCGTNFVVKCGVSEVSVDSLTVGDNVTWAIDMDQADIDVGTLTAGRNVRIVVSNAERPGASMVLPVTVSRLSGNLSTWCIVFPERPDVERGVKLENGHLCTDPMPTVILMK